MKAIVGLVAIAVAAALGGCGGGEPESPTAAPVPAREPAPEAAPTSESERAEEPRLDEVPGAAMLGLQFEDATDVSGLRFTHDPAVSDAWSYPEIIGAGSAVLDYDSDGDLDVYLVQGGRIPGTEIGTPMPNRLFRNDGGGRFVDVTEDVGAAAHVGFGMGAYAFDLEGDGDPDLLLTNVGPDALLRNDGDGTFTDVTAAAGIAGDGFSLGAVAFDIEGDGDLDLYIAEYVLWRPGTDPDCFTSRGTRDYCGPANYRGRPDRLYRNRGDGTFEDVSQTSGIAGVSARSMGVVAADFDGDGREDIYVANDGEPNLLWRNLGDGSFAEEAAILGCAVNADGLSEASMGVAVADVDDDGDFDLLCTHLAGETHTFYRNDGGWFTDATTGAGIGRWSRPDTGFGAEWLDLDHDGDEDLVIANGAVMLPMQPRDPALPYAESDRVATGEGDRWPEAVELPAPRGRPAMGRGLLAADLDGDARVDLLFSNNRGQVQLLRNTTADTGAWIGLRVVGASPNRDALGAVVTLQVGERTETRLVRPHRGYLTSHDPVVRIGLGDVGDGTHAVSVRWPDGVQERFEGLEPGQIHVIERGTGEFDASGSTG